jgi:hypothetical protein
MTRSGHVSLILPCNAAEGLSVESKPRAHPDAPGTGTLGTNKGIRRPRVPRGTPDLARQLMKKQSEGEGDRILAYWRRAHGAACSRECSTIGREPSETMPLICERLRVIFRKI